MTEAIKNTRKKVIIHADDLGLSLGFNQGILRAAQEGVLVSTCLRVNAPGYRDAIENIIPKIPHVGIGLHLNIVEGHTRQISPLAAKYLFNANGKYKFSSGARGFLNILKLRNNKEFLKEVEIDYRNQIEIAIKDHPEIDHLNTHQHSHGVPEIFEIVCRLAKEFNIRHVRLPREPLFLAGNFWQHSRLWFFANIGKWLVLNFFAKENKETAIKYGIKTNDKFIGLLYTGFMTQSSVLKGIKATKNTDQLIEVMLHPAIPTGLKEEVFLTDYIRDFVFCKGRRHEIDALTSPLVRKYIDENHILTNYSKMGKKVYPPIQKAVSARHARKVKVYVIINETPFYHPEYLARLITEYDGAEICGVAVVKTARGGVLDRYMLKNLSKLSLREFLLLGTKKVALQLIGKLPIFIRGTFDGSVIGVCERYGIPTRTVSQINTFEFLDHIRKFDPDVILSSNELIFKEELLSMPRLGCINRHGSLLPAYGGILPAFRAIQFGEQFTGASIHKMVPKIDKGEVLAQMAVPIYQGDSLSDLYKYCFDLSFIATCKAIDRLAGRDNSKFTHEEIKESYYSFPNDDDWREFRKNGGRFI